MKNLIDQQRRSLWSILLVPMWFFGAGGFIEATHGLLTHQAAILLYILVPVVWHFVVEIGVAISYGRDAHKEEIRLLQARSEASEATALRARVAIDLIERLEALSDHLPPAQSNPEAP